MVIHYASSEAGALKVAEECLALGAKEVVTMKADMSDMESIQSLFADITKNHGKLDILVNNAGITADGLVMRMKPQQWQSVIDTNLSGVFYSSQAFFKQACKNKIPGRIINIASVVGQFGNPGQANYSAAKGGVLALTMSNAKEFAARGVTVNAICPGFINSDMTKDLSADYLDKMKGVIPLGRLGNPEEVAGMTRFLALDGAADYITGHHFNVDGGLAIGC